MNTCICIITTEYLHEDWNETLNHEYAFMLYSNDPIVSSFVFDNIQKFKLPENETIVESKLIYSFGVVTIEKDSQERKGRD